MPTFVSVMLLATELYVIWTWRGDV